MHALFFPSRLQLLNKELREAKSAKMKMSVMTDTEPSSLQSSQNHLPQSLPDTAASAQKASSALPVAPTHSSPPASVRPHLGCLIPVASQLTKIKDHIIIYLVCYKILGRVPLNITFFFLRFFFFLHGCRRYLRRVVIA